MVPALRVFPHPSLLCCRRSCPQGTGPARLGRTAWDRLLSAWSVSHRGGHTLTEEAGGGSCSCPPASTPPPPTPQGVGVCASAGLPQRGGVPVPEQDRGGHLRSGVPSKGQEDRWVGSRGPQGMGRPEGVSGRPAQPWRPPCCSEGGRATCRELGSEPWPFGLKVTGTQSLRSWESTLVLAVAWPCLACTRA